MRLLFKICLIVIIVLSLAAGAAKVLQTPEETAFFAAAGLGSRAMMIIGVLQIVGAALAVPGKTRVGGADLIAAAFIVSTGIIFYTGNIPFALFSLLPALAAIFVALQARKGMKFVGP